MNACLLDHILMIELNLVEYLFNYYTGKLYIHLNHLQLCHTYHWYSSFLFITQV